MKVTRLSVIPSASIAMLALVATAPMAAAEDTTPGQVTFTKDVAPILQARCQTCHRPDTFAPMSLLTYEEARPWAKSIKQKVVAREMPPWYIDKHVGVRNFKNDVSLSDQEIATLVKWADSGAPKGNPADMPPPRKFDDSDQWHIRPDLVVQLPKDIVVPAQAADRWIDVTVDAGLTEDRYIKGVEIKPIKGFRAVHHASTSMKHEDDADDGDDNGDVQGKFLNEYALGKNADVFPDGAGRLIKAGTKINFNLHLHPIGQETPINVALALQLYPKGYTPKYAETTEKVGDPKDLDIPPGENNVRFDGYNTLTKPARMLSFQPHLHNRGKASCMEAIYPGGHKVETLSCVSKYQFAWHLVYLYAEDEQPLLPAGTILHLISWYDNSPGNKFNPDPDNLITYGQRTIDEMGGAWVSYYYLSDEEFKQQTEARKAKQQIAKKTD
jgi:hypothetical protein